MAQTARTIAITPSHFHAGRSVRVLLVIVPVVLAGLLLWHAASQGWHPIHVSVAVGILAIIACIFYAVVANRAQAATFRLQVTNDDVVLKRGRDREVARAERSAVAAGVGTFHYRSFDDRTNTFDIPVLTLTIGSAELVVLFWGNVGGWPTGTRATSAPRYAISEDDFIWLAETFCGQAALPDVDFAERMERNPI